MYDNGDAVVNGECEMTNLPYWTIEGGFPNGITNLYIGSSAPSPTHVFALNYPTYVGAIYCYQIFDTPIPTQYIDNFSIYVSSIGVPYGQAWVDINYNDSSTTFVDTTNGGSGDLTFRQIVVNGSNLDSGKFVDQITLHCYQTAFDHFIEYDNVKLMVDLNAWQPSAHTYYVGYDIQYAIHKTTYSFEVYQNINYTYYAELFTDGYAKDNGIVSVYITPLSSSSSISWVGGDYNFAFNESFTNGYYYFLISAVNGTGSTLYRGIQQRYYVNNTLVLIYGQLIQYDVYGSTSTTPTNPSGNDTTFVDGLIAALIPLGIFVLIPILFVLMIGGLPSLFIGIGISSIVVVWAFPQYFWIIPLVGLAFILLIVWKH